MSFIGMPSFSSFQMPQAQAPQQTGAQQLEQRRLEAEKNGFVPEWMKSNINQDLVGNNPANALAVQQASLYDMRANQSMFGNQLGQQATGQALSPALQAALMQNQAAQVGMAKSMKGGNQALAQRNAAGNASQANQQAILAGTAQAQNMFGNYLNQQQQYNMDLKNHELGSVQQRRAADAASTAANNQMAGALLGTAGTIGAAYLGKPPTPAYNGGLVNNNGVTTPQRSRAANYFKGGGVVPGANQGGTTDSIKNDTVPAMLSPGEAIIPKSIMNGPNPAKNAAKFVQALLAKKGL